MDKQSITPLLPFSSLKTTGDCSEANVPVRRLLCEDSIDERITELLEQKQRIFDEFADKSVAAEQSEAIEKETEIDEKNFEQIIGEEINRINAQRAAEKQDIAQ